eukprot:GGOE01018387.1.p1 GENE.GGOE01018387.1~~GGOE01018387.1.p1  ORF type:complete len:806 (-),score=319.25 GGOE01018387.1:204-2594(-)
MSELQPYAPDILQIKRDALHEQQQALKERQLAVELQMALASQEEDQRQRSAKLQREKEELEARERALRLAWEELDGQAAKQRRELEERMKALQTREEEMKLELELAREQLEVAALKHEKQWQEEAAKREEVRQAEHMRSLQELEQKRAALGSEEARVVLESARKEEELKKEEARLAMLRFQQEQQLEGERARMFKEQAAALQEERLKMIDETERLAKEFRSGAEAASQLRSEKERVGRELACREALLRLSEAWLKSCASLQQEQVEALQDILLARNVELMRKLQDLLPRAQSVSIAEGALEEQRATLERRTVDLEIRLQALHIDEERLRARQATLEEEVALHERQHRLRVELLEEREQDAERDLVKRRAALEEERLVNSAAAMNAADASDRLQHLLDEELEANARLQRVKREEAEGRLSVEALQTEEAELQTRLNGLRKEETTLRLQVESWRASEAEVKARLQEMKDSEEAMAKAFKERVREWKEEEARIAVDMAVADRRLQVREIEKGKQKRRNEPMTEAPQLVAFAIVRQMRVLEVHSPYKARAKVLGWLEPTLLFALLHDWDRAFIKKRLMVNLDVDEGDPFFVAYQLVTDRTRGLAYETENEFRHASRSTQVGPSGTGPSCWYDALCETLRRSVTQTRTFHERTPNEKLKECDDPHSRVILELERALFKVLEKQIDAILTNAQRQVCQAILSSPRSSLMRANLRAANWPELDALWMALAVLFHDKAAPTLDEMEMEEPEFWSFSGSATGNLLRAQSDLVNVVFRLLITRLELAGKGIDLAPYFMGVVPPMLQ